MCQYNEIPFDFEVYGKCCGGVHLTRKQENKVHAMMKKNAYKSNFREDSLYVHHITLNMCQLCEH